MMELNQIVTRMVFENYGVEKYYDSHMEDTINLPSSFAQI